MKRESQSAVAGPAGVRRLTVEHVAWLEDLLSRGITVRIRATGFSMRPSIDSGSHLRFRAFDRPICVGDVVLSLEHGRRPLIHRVEHLKRRGTQLWVQTRGDGAPAPDAWVPAACIVGRLVRVEAASRTEWARTLRAIRIGALSSRARRARGTLGAALRHVQTVWGDWATALR